MKSSSYTRVLMIVKTVYEIVMTKLDKRMQDFNYFSIVFYYIFRTTYQRIADFFCPVIFLDFHKVCCVNKKSVGKTKTTHKTFSRSQSSMQNIFFNQSWKIELQCIYMATATSVFSYASLLESRSATELAPFFNWSMNKRKKFCCHLVNS